MLSKKTSKVTKYVLDENLISSGKIEAMIHIQKVDLNSLAVSQIIAGINKGRS